MTTITVRERERCAIGGPGGLGEDVVAGLARLLPALPPGTLGWEHRAIRLGPVCGVLRVGPVTLEILPKIAGYGRAEARGVLVAMLRMVGLLAATRIGSAGLAQQRLHLLDIFILAFCARVNDLLRGGALRRYELEEANLTTVRGRIDFVANARQNPFDRSRLACRYDALTADNDHNRALKFVLRRLLAHAEGLDARTATTGLLRRMEEVADRPCTADAIERLPFDRRSKPWQPTFGQAAWLLRGLYPDVLAGRTEGSCLLFSMERLFEGFVGAVLRRHWRGRGASVVLQGPGRDFARSAAGGPAFRMRPDVTVLVDDRPVLIADAKWKRLEPRTANAGVGRSDLYQMAAYASRYRCRDLALLYPSDDGVPPGELERFTLADALGTRVRVYALDVPALVRGAGLPEGLCPLTAASVTVVTGEGPGT